MNRQEIKKEAWEKIKGNKWNIWWPLLIIGFTCVQGALTYILNYLNTWVGGKITNLLKADLFKKMLTF